MAEDFDILISLRTKYAESIFSGTKSVELRKRRPNVPLGARVWIYETSPVAAIRGYANVSRIETGSPSTIWRKLGCATGTSKREFDEYFESRAIAHAIVLVNVMELENPLTLARIRELIGDFHPPQFYCRLNGARSHLRLLSRKYQRVDQSTICLPPATSA